MEALAALLSGLTLEPALLTWFVVVTLLDLGIPAEELGETGAK